MRNPLLFAAAVAATFCFTSDGTAGEVQPSLISERATWLLHVDLDACRDSQLFSGKQSDSQSSDRVSSVNRWIEDRYGVELDDTSGITFYETESEDTITIVFSDFDEDQIKRTLARQDASDTTEVEGLTVFSWNPNRNREFAATDSKSGYEERSQGQTRRTLKPTTASNRIAFFADKAVFATSLEGIRDGIKTIQNESGLDEMTAEAISELPDDAPVVGAILSVDDQIFSRESGEGDGSLNQLPLLSGMFESVTQSTFAVVPKDANNATFILRSRVGSDKSADRVGEVFEGIRALAALASRDGDKTSQENTSNWQAALPQIEQSGNVIESKWTINVAQLQRLAEDRMERIENRLEKSMSESENRSKLRRWKPRLRQAQTRSKSSSKRRRKTLRVT